MKIKYLIFFLGAITLLNGVLFFANAEKNQEMTGRFLSGVLSGDFLPQPIAIRSSFKVDTSDYAKGWRFVYFRNGKLDGIDSRSFVFLGTVGQGSYVMDKSSVYYFDFVNRNRDTSKDSPIMFAPHLPEPLRADYSNIDNLVSLYGRKFEGVDPETFEVIKIEQNLSYFKDKNTVYFNMRKIEDSDPNTFSYLIEYNEYAKDKKYMYYNGMQIAGADPASFELVPGQRVWAKDKDFVFLTKNKREEFDAETFEVLENRYYIKDKNRVLYNHEMIDVLDPATYELIDVKDFRLGIYAKDKYAVYFERRLIENADPITFEVLAHSEYVGVFSYGRDERAIYYNGKELMEADIRSFKILEERTSSVLFEDKNATYTYDGIRKEK